MRANAGCAAAWPQLRSLEVLNRYLAHTEHFRTLAAQLGGVRLPRLERLAVRGVAPEEFLRNFHACRPQLSRLQALEVAGRACLVPHTCGAQPRCSHAAQCAWRALAGAWPVGWGGAGWGGA